jgi:hypothetical protein
MSPSTSNKAEATATFTSVWFDGDGKMQFVFFNDFYFPFWGFRAFETKGTLLCFNDHLEFVCSSGKSLKMTNIQGVTTKNLRMSFADPNEWIAIKYGVSPNLREVYVMDGSFLGWGGATGGTTKLFNAIRAQVGKK